ncbi:Uu.00g053240.m01.CDS01 [Anthostomella pinea]|uniref:Uu.00g053240.m01.CDS01 n=1 Tax=Anthostomella pinea TaxID=933095 RepID=A0AAI8VWE0_9PEZI|nr:Uu.00g053240.m01.CDS01 [Anthostomella pinea]
MDNTDYAVSWEDQFMDPILLNEDQRICASPEPVVGTPTEIERTMLDEMLSLAASSATVAGYQPQPEQESTDYLLDPLLDSTSTMPQMPLNLNYQQNMGLAPPPYYDPCYPSMQDFSWGLRNPMTMNPGYPAYPGGQYPLPAAYTPYTTPWQGAGMPMPAPYSESIRDKPTITDNIRRVKRKPKRKPSKPAKEVTEKVAKRRVRRQAVIKGQKQGQKPESAMAVPLSEFLKDVDVGDIDIEAYANRGTAARLEETAQRRGKTGKTPRPLNPAMLYRKAYQHRVRRWQEDSHYTENAISVTTANSWHSETEEVKDRFRRLAKIEAQGHSAAFPDYEYKPERYYGVKRKAVNYDEG